MQPADSRKFLLDLGHFVGKKRGSGGLQLCAHVAFIVEWRKFFMDFALAVMRSDNTVGAALT